MNERIKRITYDVLQKLNRIIFSLCCDLKLLKVFD